MANPRDSKKMDGLLERILEQNAKEKRERIFHYSSYWGSWSRVLLDHNPERIVFGDKIRVPEIVELNLTPIRGYSDWDKHVAPIVFRVHGTARDRADLDERELPPNVLERMKTNLGEKLTQKLLTEDWLAMIDLELCQRNSNGGCPLAKCAKIPLCFSCEQAPRKYIDGLCETCNRIAVQASDEGKGL